MPLPFQTNLTQHICANDNDNTIFALFWDQMCIHLGTTIVQLFQSDSKKIEPDVAALYPALRAAALDMLSAIQDTMHAGSLLPTLHSNTNVAPSVGVAIMDDGLVIPGEGGCGIMGGSCGLNDGAFFGSTLSNLVSKDHGPVHSISDEEESSHLDMGLGLGLGGGTVGADSWTKPDLAHTRNLNNTILGSTTTTNNNITTQTSSALSSIFSSPEWKTLQGYGSTTGLYPLQKSFSTALHQRLSQPLQSMFLEDAVVDENEIAVSVLPTLPTTTHLEALEI